MGDWRVLNALFCEREIYKVCILYSVVLERVFKHILFFTSLKLYILDNRLCSITQECFVPSLVENGQIIVKGKYKTKKQTAGRQMMYKH